jgi:hypothetical protein
MMAAERGLRDFEYLQAFYMRAQDIGGADSVREHISQLVEPFDLDVDAILSIAGSCLGNFGPLVETIASVANSAMMAQISAGVEAAEPGSALWGFAAEWRSATSDRHESAAVDASEAALANAIASNDLAETGRLLMGIAADKKRIKARNLPAKLLRKPAAGCPVLDVAVGCAALDVAKCLLEFHETKPTRETLKMALSLGNIELVRICWGRLPDLEQRKRLDLLEVASDFHQLELVAWLFRDADTFDRELFFDFAIRRHLADALLAGLVDGFKPWWARLAAAKWPPTRSLEFVAPPDGFVADGGWCRKTDGKTKSIPRVQGPWTREKASDMGVGCDVEAVVLPSEVKAIGSGAFAGYSALKSVTLPHHLWRIKGSNEWGWETLTGAFSLCRSLVTVTIPPGCEQIGRAAFMSCTSLETVAIGEGCTTIGYAAFKGCSALASISLPRSCLTIEYSAFGDCTSLAEIAIQRRCKVEATAFYNCPNLKIQWQ